MCKTHYRRTKEGKDVLAPIRDLPRKEWCTVEGCDRPHATRGYCGGHAYRAKNGLDMNAPWSGSITVCKADNCDRPFKAKGYCDRHYPRFVRGGADAVNKPFAEKYSGPPRTVCELEGCGLPHVGTGLCRRHINWKLNYNLSREDMEKLIDRPCAICGEKDLTPHLDHDHSCCAGGGYADKCGKCVRGVLCSHCNKALGLFQDDPERMRAAAEYLESWDVEKSLDRVLRRAN